MRKIPTLFVRDPENMKRVLPEVNPGCEWVLAGEGTPTRKYDGTCVMLDRTWWARREVKPGKAAPDGWVEVDADEVTGKRVGWEPAEQSSFAKYLYQAIARLTERELRELPRGTYELVGPKINGNPERFQHNSFVRHGQSTLQDVPRDFEGLAAWLTATQYEGVVWHHLDGRMVKLKRRDFA